MSVALLILVSVWAGCLLAVLAIWAWSVTGGRADLDVRPEPAATASSPAPAVPM